MKHLFSSIVLTLGAACSVEEAAGPEPATPPPTAAADTAVTEPVDMPAIPSQADEDAAAAQAIDANNADAEFDKLKDEIDGGN